MTAAYSQSTAANLVAVIDDCDANAIAIFFNHNRLIYRLIHKYGGWNLSRELCEQIYDEVCVQVLKAPPQSYNPSYAPATYLQYPVREASRIVKREQLAGGVTSRANRKIVFDQFEDDAPVDECNQQINVGMRAVDMENRIDAEKLLKRMPPDLAAILILEHWHGLSFKEACARIGIERTSAYRKIRAFRRCLN